MIFLAFLKALGFIIILIFVIGALLLLSLLFAPLHFSFDGIIHGKPEAGLNIRWLFGLVSLKGSYKNDKLSYSLSYPFKHFKEKAEERKRVKKSEKTVNKKKPAVKKDVSLPEKAAPKTGKNINLSSSTADSTAEKAEKPKAQSRLSVIRGYFNAVMSVENKGDIINCFVKNIKQILKNFKFKVFKIDLRFGFNDPSLTGELLGLLYAGGPALIKGVNIQADFNEAVLKADADIKGRGNLFNIAVPAVKFVLNKNVRKVLF